MTEPVFLRKPFAIALVTVLQIVLPPLVALGCLVGAMSIYDVHFNREYGVLSSLIMALAALLLQPPKNLGEQLILRRVPLALSWLIRWSILVVAILLIGYATKYSEEFSRRVIFTWMVVTPIFLIASALLLHELMKRMLYDPQGARKVVMAGCNETSVALAAKIKHSRELCMTVTGFFDDRSRERLGANGNVDLVGGLAELGHFVKANAIDVIFISLPIRHITRVLDLLDDLRDTTASIYYVPDLFMFDLIQARTGSIAGIPVVAMCETPFYGYRGVVKRLFDIVLSFMGLLVLSPLLALIALIVRASSPGPAIFKQRRYGLDGREIYIYKFRSMTVMEDGARVTQAQREDLRITTVGRLLRRTSLDELPQLYNVLQGRMSLVGPRPHAVAHNEEYRKLIKGYMVRHKVLPGITGLAQVNGLRGETIELAQMAERVRFDLEYLRTWSVLLDIKILIKTVFRMLKDDPQAY